MQPCSARSYLLSSLCRALISCTMVMFSFEPKLSVSRLSLKISLNTQNTGVVFEEDTGSASCHQHAHRSTSSNTVSLIITSLFVMDHISAFLFFFFSLSFSFFSVEAAAVRLESLSSSGLCVVVTSRLLAFTSGQTLVLACAYLLPSAGDSFCI